MTTTPSEPVDPPVDAPLPGGEDSADQDRADQDRADQNRAEQDRQAEDHAAAERHESAGALRDQLAARPNTEDRLAAISAAEKALRGTAEAAARDRARPAPARTSHPTGPQQAATNAETESPA